MKRFFAGVWEILEVVIIALVSVFVIRTFIVQPFLVRGASMSPTFEDGNYLLIDELTYRFREPSRGEVIVFRPPTGQRDFFIKRIVGLPGEKITIRSGSVTITPPLGDTPFVLTESYLSPDVKTTGEANVTLADNEYFVMGDNRANSFDSRHWGPLGRPNMVGLVRLKIFPFGDFGIFNTPAYAHQ